MSKLIYNINFKNQLQFNCKYHRFLTLILIFDIAIIFATTPEFYFRFQVCSRCFRYYPVLEFLP